MAYKSTSDQVLKEFESIPHRNKLILTDSPRDIESDIIFSLDYNENSWFDEVDSSGLKYYQRYDFKTWFYKAQI